MSDNFAIAAAQRCARVLYSRLRLFDLFRGGVSYHTELMSVFVTECSGVHCDMLTRRRWEEGRTLGVAGEEGKGEQEGEGFGGD